MAVTHLPPTTGHDIIHEGSLHKNWNIRALRRPSNQAVSETIRLEVKGGRWSHGSTIIAMKGGRWSHGSMGPPLTAMIDANRFRNYLTA